MKKILVFVLSLTLALTAMLGLTACSVKDVDAVKEKGTLVIGITDYEPMDYKEKGSDVWIGFDADLANEFGEKLGVKVEFVEIDWDNKTVELSSGAIDLIWNGMTADDELDKSIDFSVAYAENSQCVVVKKGSESSFNSIDKLKTATSVAVENGSAGNNVATASGLTNISAVGTQIDSLLEVNAGSSEAAIIDYTMAASIIGKGDYANLAIVDTTVLSFDREVFAVGVRTNSDLAKELNNFFKEKYNDGSLKALAEKYGVGLNESALKAL